MSIPVRKCDYDRIVKIVNERGDGYFEVRKNATLRAIVPIMIEKEDEDGEGGSQIGADYIVDLYRCETEQAVSLDELLDDFDRCIADFTLAERKAGRIRVLDRLGFKTEVRIVNLADVPLESLLAEIGRRCHSGQEVNQDAEQSRGRG